MIRTTHAKANAVTIHEQRVDTYIANGPEVRKYLGWNRQDEALNVSRVVTTYRQRVIDGDPGEIEVTQRVYARTTLKDGSPSNVETAIKEWTPEVDALLTEIAVQNSPEPKRASIHTKDILNAYDAFEGDDVGTFTAAWDEYLAGTDTPCTAAADGLHEVTAGSCDLCGSRNFA